MPRLPAELTDVIVDFLYGDEESLANCSLVCKEWLPTARYHIIKKLLLYPWNVEAFMNLITHPSATLVPHIHHLKIYLIDPGHTKLFHAMFLCLPRFKFLRRLELQGGIAWTSFTASSVDGLICKSVTDMTLVDLPFNDFTDVMSVVASFPSLKRLSVINPRFFRQTSSHMTPGLDLAHFLQHTRLPNIHDLVVIEVPDQPTYFLDWFSCHGTLVNSLSVALGSLKLPSLNQYLQVLGPSLLFLQVDVRLSSVGAYPSFFSNHQFYLLNSTSRNIPFRVESVLQHPSAEATFLQLQFQITPYHVIYDSINACESNVLVYR
jgi:hypothetical protein